MENGQKTLAQWRSDIDFIDAELLQLLNRRATIACEIAAIKVSSGLAAYDPQRETEVLNRIAAHNPGPLDRQSMMAIFGAVIHETRRLGTQRMQQLSRIASEHRVQNAAANLK